MAATHVRDDGKFFSADVVAQVDQQLADLKKQKNRNVVVETFAAPPQALEANLSRGDPKAAYAVFGQERIKAESADVFVAITRTPSHLEVTTASGLQKDGFSREQTAQALLAAFKQQRFDAGLQMLVSDLKNLPARSDKLRFDTPAAASGAAPTASPRAGQDASPAEGIPAPAKSTGAFGGLGCFGLVIIAVVAFIVITLIRKLMGGGRNAANRGYGPQGMNDPNNPSQQGPGNQGYGNQGGGGGFGRGMAGGVLGGLLGGYLGNRAFGQGDQSATNANDPNAANDNNNLDDAGSSGGDFSGGDSGGDGGSSGGDF